METAKEKLECGLCLAMIHDMVSESFSKFEFSKEFINKVGEETGFSDYPRYGEVGQNYGVQWRKFTNFQWINGDPHWTEPLDQIANIRK